MVTLSLICTFALVYIVLGLAFKLVCGVLKIALLPVKWLLGIIFGIIGIVLLIAFGTALLFPFLILLLIVVALLKVIL